MAAETQVAGSQAIGDGKASTTGKHTFVLWRTLFEIDLRYTPIKPIGKVRARVGRAAVGQWARPGACSAPES